MPEVRPFTGLTYDPSVAGPFDTLTAPPYDVISPIDQERYYRASPYNVVRLILGREEPDDHHSSNKYTRASEYLRDWWGRGVLRPTPDPSVFPYEMRFHLGGRVRRLRGVVAEVGLEPWGGSIIAHERTFPGPVKDRLALLTAVQANLSPVYAVLAGPSGLAGFLDEATAEQPLLEIEDEAGTAHQLWANPGLPDGLATAFRERELMIADGHHRYTVALAYQELMQARSGPGPWDAVMMLVVDAEEEEPPVLPIHRIITDGEDPLPAGDVAVRDLAEVLASLSDGELTFGSVQMERGELTHRIGQLRGPPPTVWALHDQILDRIHGAHIRFVPDAVLAEEAVRSGRAMAAYLLPPTNVERVRSVIASGGRLPQKSTYFWPKPRTGMVIRPFAAN